MNNFRNINIYDKNLRESTSDPQRRQKILQDYYVSLQEETHAGENNLGPSSSKHDSTTITDTITPTQQRWTQEVLESSFNNSQKPSSSSSTVRSYKPQRSAYSSRPSSKDRLYSVSKLPSKRHAILTGSRSLIKRIGKGPASDVSEDDTSLPLCYLLKEPVELEDVTINSTEGMNGHILVCLHREVINMFKFIYNLRSPNIRADDIQDIVLLCSKKPSRKIFELINIFPKVYYMEVYYGMSVPFIPCTK